MADKQIPLAPNGVFRTLQGEGAMRGLPMTFIRLAGCSVGCPQCDTDYRVAERCSVDEIVHRVVRSLPNQSNYPATKWVWITGGEPTDHDLAPLIGELRKAQMAVALATAGVRATKGLDVSFLSVSPHSLERWVQRSGHELKIVPFLNGMTLEAVKGLDLRFGYKYVQPLWGSQESLDICKSWALNQEGWALTDQGHKTWGLP